MTDTAATVDKSATTAPCPKCATTMALAAITRHPLAAHMERHTFLCTRCNQTKTYMLPAGQVAALWGNGAEAATAHHSTP